MTLPTRDGNYIFSKYQNSRKAIGEMTRMERWLAYFSNKLHTAEIEELAMSDAAIKNAVDDTGIFMQDMEERLRYINRQMAIMDYNTDMRVSREEGHRAGLEEGHKAGLEEGHKAGLEEGHKAGLADGEKIADRRTALNMLKAKEPIEKITQYTSLTEAEIHDLAKQL